MMYGNPYPPTASAAKAIVVFLSLILVGTVVFVLLASGNFGPKAEAQARQIESQTRLDEAKQSLALQYQEARYRQQLEQDARNFELWQALIAWGTRALVITGAVALIVIATGKSVQWVYQARQVAHATAASHTTIEPSPAASEALRMRNIYALFEQMNDRIEHLEQRVAILQAQLLAAQTQLERLQTHGGNGSDPGEKIIPFKTVTG